MQTSQTSQAQGAGRGEWAHSWLQGPLRRLFRTQIARLLGRSTLGFLHGASRLAREGEERSAENRHPFAPHRFLPDSMTISPGVRSHGYRGYRLNNRVHLPNHFHCTVQARRPPGGPLLVSLWVCFCPRPGISWRADSLGSSPGLSFQGASDHWFVCPSL